MLGYSGIFLRKENKLDILDDLDHLLLDQLHVARRIRTKMKKARKIMGDDPTLLQCQDLNNKRIEFLESMIQDKTLLHKKVKRKKRKKELDILTRGTSYEWYRNIMIASNIGYKMMVDSFLAYMSFFNNKKGK